MGRNPWAYRVDCAKDESAALTSDLAVAIAGPDKKK